MEACERCGTGTVKVGGCAGCNPNLHQSLDGLSAVWKMRFAMIERAGGSTYSNIAALSVMERFRIMFNFWAFLFGTFYFLAKGMWRRAITYTVAVFTVAAVIDIFLDASGSASTLFHPMNYAGPMLFACTANLCYYKEKVLGDRGWW